MTEDYEPPDWVKCCVCGKNIYIAAKRRVKKVNGSGCTAISEVRKLRDGRHVCSNVCFSLAVNPASESIGLGPD